MLKSAIKTLAALLLLTACNEMVMEPGQMGSISLSLSSDVEVEAPTKAGSVDCSNFKVSVTGKRQTGEDYLEEYIYSQMKANEVIPYGSYVIAAQSSTEEDAVEGLGCVRYYGKTSEIKIESQAAVPVTVKCKMVNAKATLTLDQSFLDDFADITASLKIGERVVQVPLTQENPSGGQEIYFNVPETGGNLVYTVTATIAKGTDQERVLTYTNANSSQPMILLPAKWAKILIKSNHNGLIGGPDISVDDEMGENSSTEFIDPEGGTEIVEGNMNLPKITVNTNLADATVIDCVLGVK